MTVRLKIVRYVLILFLGLFAGCKSSTVDSRRQERIAAYSSLAPETRALVDNGQIRTGMSSDAVYIAWGAPSEVLQSQDGSGLKTTWLYYGTTMQEYRYWNYREVPTRTGVFLERYLDTDYNPQNFVRAEIIFENDKVKSWRMLPHPQ